MRCVNCWEDLFVKIISVYCRNSFLYVMFLFSITCDFSEDWKNKLSRIPFTSFTLTVLIKCKKKMLVSCKR